MSELSLEIIEYLNEIGIERVKIAVTMADCEFFRAYMMRKFNWFKSRTDTFKPGDIQHIVEVTWYRYYRDNGKLPKKINLNKMFDETLTRQEIIDIFMEIYKDYKNKGYDLLNNSSPEEYNCCIFTNL